MEPDSKLRDRYGNKAKISIELPVPVPNRSWV
jgi:hypothetical protein